MKVSVAVTLLIVLAPGFLTGCTQPLTTHSTAATQPATHDFDAYHNYNERSHDSVTVHRGDGIQRILYKQGSLGEVSPDGHGGHILAYYDDHESFEAGHTFSSEEVRGEDGRVYVQRMTESPSDVTRYYLDPAGKVYRVTKNEEEHATSYY